MNNIFLALTALALFAIGGAFIALNTGGGVGPYFVAALAFMAGLGVLLILVGEVRR